MGSQINTMMSKMDLTGKVGAMVNNDALRNITA